MIDFKIMLKFHTINKVVSCVPSIIDKLTQKLESKQFIQPFDQVFDEDQLEASYHKLNVINELLEKEPCNQNILEHKKDIENDIENLLLSRIVKYSEWKQSILKNMDDVIEIQKQINELIVIQQHIQNFMSNRKKTDVITLTLFHNMINTLLHISSHKKENTPYGTFISAYKKGVISKELFEKLTNKKS